MRILLIVLVAGLLAATAWFALMRGLNTPYLRGAPQVEDMVDSAAREAVADLGAEDVIVDGDGRDVVLSGPVQSEDLRDKLVEATGRVYLLAEVTDSMYLLPIAQPFTFEAVKNADGAWTLEGHAPTRAAEEAVLEIVRSQSSGAPVEVALELAAGAPDGDWIGMASTGLVALSHLSNGRFALSDRTALLSGAVESETAASAALASVAGAPMGDWTTQIEGLLSLADPFVLRALKTADGAVVLAGNAPDAAVLTRLTEAAQSLSEEPLTGELTLARGMPAQNWPDRVTQALEALGKAESGLLEVSGDTISLSIEVDTIEDRDAIEVVLDESWVVEITVLNPPPPADMSIELRPDGKMFAGGRLPEGMDPGVLTAALPELILGEMQTDPPGTAVDWVPALEGLNIVLPRFQSAKVRLLDRSFRLTGKLRRGFSAQGSSAALRSVLTRDWDLVLDISESAPLAELILSKQGPEIALSGVLPAGLDTDDALDIFGPEAGGEGIAGGGEGNAAEWRSTLEAAASSMRFFSEATGLVANGRLEMNGTLLPGYGANPVQEWLGGHVAQAWEVGLSAVETEPSEGDARLSLVSGETEFYRRGFWLPQVSFPVTQARCEAEAARALESGKIKFVTGSARIDQSGRALLNRLSAVAIRCLNSSSLHLEIGGHTDSVGNDEANQKLSEERALAVQAALAERGVRTDAMNAIGYGEGRPVASNDVPEGRAQNRRITFEWAGSGQ